jgi:hypothetical protein
MEADCPSEGVSTFAFIQRSCCLPAQLGLFQPIQSKESPLDPSDLP